MNLDRFPRVRLCHRPTPLEPMRRLTDYLGGPRLFVKRDDCTGLATGGNKARKLEFLMAEAMAQGATTVITVGGVQSNHCRQTAAAAARLAMKCEVVLQHVSRFASPTYDDGGNVLLDQLLGAQVHVAASAAASAAKIAERVESLRRRGEVPYVIPVGGSTALGALGYVDAALELADQAREQSLNVTHCVVTTGSTTTHAGLVVGFAGAARSGTAIDPRVEGISVVRPRDEALALVRQKARETAELLELDEPTLDDRVIVHDEYLGDGYGAPTGAMVEAVALVARLEGLLLDPVYTGKAMAGLIDLVRRGHFAKTDNIVFWHTGGTPALFPYRESFTEALRTGE